MPEGLCNFKKKEEEEEEEETAWYMLLSYLSITITK